MGAHTWVLTPGCSLRGAVQSRVRARLRITPTCKLAAAPYQMHAAETWFHRCAHRVLDGCRPVSAAVQPPSTRSAPCASHAGPFYCAGLLAATPATVDPHVFIGCGRCPSEYDMTPDLTFPLFEHPINAALCHPLQSALQNAPPASLSTPHDPSGRLACQQTRLRDQPPSTPSSQAPAPPWPQARSHRRTAAARPPSSPAPPWLRRPHSRRAALRRASLRPSRGASAPP